jgi:hypothetical protein
MDISASFPRRIGTQEHRSHFSQTCINQGEPDGADNETPEEVRRPSICENERNESASKSVLEST